MTRYFFGYYLNQYSQPCPVRWLEEDSTPIGSVFKYLQTVEIGEFSYGLADLDYLSKIYPFKPENTEEKPD